MVENNQKPTIHGKPLVSILIPLFNEEKLIAATIECCINQTYDCIEVIVVDDHSTDNSLSIAQSYESDNVHVFVNPGKGVSSARNYAFKQCKGEYIKYLDADDCFSLNLIKSQVEKMMEEKSPFTIVYSAYKNEYFNKGLEEVPSVIGRDYSPGIEFILDTLRHSGIFSVINRYLFPRKLVEQYGIWNEKQSYCEDIEFNISLLAHADKVVYTGGDYAVYRLFYDSNHLHTKGNRRHAIRKIDVFFDVAKLLLNYKDDQETRKICSHFLSLCVYRDYDFLYSRHHKYIERLFNANHLEWEKIESPRYAFLYKVLGWNTTTYILRRMRKLTSR